VLVLTQSCYYIIRSFCCSAKSFFIFMYHFVILVGTMLNHFVILKVNFLSDIFEISISHY
jgi:hypothetical protein